MTRNLTEWLERTHNGDAQLVCAWRKRAWRAMRPVVERFVAQLAAPAEDMSTPAPSASRFMQAIDEAGLAAKISPIGKRWEQEREVIRKAVDGSLWPEPTDEDRAAVLVAIDLVEELRFAEAIALLDAQAPRSLNRRCPACNATRGFRCHDYYGAGDNPVEAIAAMRAAGWCQCYANTRIIPHESRIA